MSIVSRIRNSFSQTWPRVRSALTVFICVALVVLCTVSAPFGTIAIGDWADRLTFWGALVSVSVLLGYSARALAVALIGEERPILFDSFIVVLMIMVLSPIACGMMDYALQGTGAPPQSLWLFVGYVFVVSSTICIGRRIAPGFEKTGYRFLPQVEPEVPNSPVAENGTQSPYPRLLKRLPEKMRGEVLRLTASDHFVEVETTKGVETLRMRFTDAIDEMEDVPGHCVHRSHWVAERAITGVERENAHKLFVVLKTGQRLPVSRKYRENLEAIGLI